MGAQISTQIVRVNGEILDRARKQVNKSRLNLGEFVSIAVDHVVTKIENGEFDLSESIEKYFLDSTSPKPKKKKTL